MSGQYKMECWGASGSAFALETSTLTVGRGGYAIGEKDLSNSTNIYICVGQSRYNGSSNLASYNNNPGNVTFAIGCAGGGATSISTTNRGELKNFASYKSEVLIVAGGGGGCEWDGHGGAGGGENGIAGVRINTDSRVGTGGTQNSGGTTGTISGDTPTNGAFGVGGYGYAYSDQYKRNDYGGQGGGGWYGGGGASYAGAAGGGSSYIGSSVSNGKTISGNQSIPSVEGGTEVGHLGHGACVITQTSFLSIDSLIFIQPF